MLGIPVNTASNQQKCDFHFPGILEYEGVVLGFNGSGKDHKKVKEVREKPGKLWNKSERKKKNAKNNHWKPGEQTGSGAERNGEKAIEDSHEDIEVEIYTMKTTGDKILDRMIKSAGKDSL